MTATKISICYFLLRVVVSRTHLWITYAVMALNILSGIAFFFITLFQCRPVDAFWNRDPLNPGRCLGMDVVITITYVYSSCGIICDFTCTFLPMFIISGLNMDRRSKYALMPIMALACVASAATVVRFVYCKDAKDPDFLCKLSPSFIVLSSRCFFSYTGGWTFDRLCLISLRCNHQHCHVVYDRTRPSRNSRQSCHTPPATSNTRPQARLHISTSL